MFFADGVVFFSLILYKAKIKGKICQLDDFSSS